MEERDYRFVKHENPYTYRDGDLTVTRGRCAARRPTAAATAGSASAGTRRSTSSPVSSTR